MTPARRYTTPADATDITMRAAWVVIGNSTGADAFGNWLHRTLGYGPAVTWLKIVLATIETARRDREREKTK